MRLALFLLLLSFTAEAYQCPEAINHDPEAKKAHSWLQRFQGVRSLHGCQIEIITCREGESHNNTAPIGEILIHTEDGRETYLAFDFPTEQTNALQTKVKTTPMAFHFYRKDRFYENINGRTEAWRFEMRTAWGNPFKLDVLELGVYTTHSQLNQPNGNQSHWFVCKPQTD